MPGTCSAQVMIDSVHPLLSSSIAGLHSFQVFLPASLVICGWETLSTVGGAVTQPLAWVWASMLAKHFL